MLERSMNVYCIGRNYVEHIKELGNQQNAEPVVFIKPENVQFLDELYQLPTFSNEIHFECELVVKIGESGVAIDIDEGMVYVEEIALGIDFTARDLQKKLKERGLPWELAKAFKNSFLLSKFYQVTGYDDLSAINFQLLKNKEVVQNGDLSKMIFSIDSIINYIIKYFPLENGDIIFTGTPKGVDKVQSKDFYEMILNGNKVHEFKVA